MRMLAPKNLKLSARFKKRLSELQQAFTMPLQHTFTELRFSGVYLGTF